MLTLDTYIVPSPAAIGQLLEREAVVMLPQQGTVKVLNEVGARIWTLADGTRTAGAIAAIICTEYDTDLPQAETDVLLFGNELARHGIIAIHGPNATSC
ncbi:MAG: PqqD family protein [Herpetosiphonaceae bacterium]|nr:PqqD family protein [Herpetosiphonaceae bacterium]